MSLKVVEFLKGVKQLYINGEWVDFVLGKMFEIVNLVMGEKLVDVVEVNSEDIDCVVRVVREVFDYGFWIKMLVVERS